MTKDLGANYATPQPVNVAVNRILLTKLAAFAKENLLVQNATNVELGIMAFRSAKVRMTRITRDVHDHKKYSSFLIQQNNFFKNVIASLEQNHVIQSTENVIVSPAFTEKSVKNAIPIPGSYQTVHVSTYECKKDGDEHCG